MSWLQHLHYGVIIFLLNVYILTFHHSSLLSDFTHTYTFLIQTKVSVWSEGLSLLGAQYYDDLNRPVTKQEAVAISHIVEKAINAVLPGAIIELMGGFRRLFICPHTCSNLRVYFVSLILEISAGEKMWGMMWTFSLLTLRREQRRGSCPKCWTGWRNRYPMNIF